MRLQNKIAIVTGAAHGIGEAIALRLAKEGAHVVVADIDIEAANKVAHEIEAIGRRALVIKTDVSKSEDADLMAQAALAKFGEIDILVNNAGGIPREMASLFCESREEVWDYVVGINLKGARNCTRSVINHMIARRYGKIVSIASITGVMGGLSGPVDYSAAKAGIIGFTLALAKEVAVHGINVNCVSPGPTETRVLSHTSTEAVAERKRLTGFGRLSKPDEIAATVAFLVSDEASFITGQNHVVAGLTTIGGPAFTD